MPGNPAWPEPYQSAISLTYDGSRHEHLDAVVPLLDELNIAGTFFAYPPNLILRVAKWRSVAKQHELGNGFLYGVVDSDGLVPEWSAEAFLEEHEEAVQLLDECGVKPQSFALPSVQTVRDVNGFPVISDLVTSTVVKMNLEVCQPFLDAYQIVRGPRPGLNRPPIDYRLPLWSVQTHDLDFDSLIAISSIAIKERAWLTLTFSPFWNEEFDAAVHEKYVRWLARHRQRVLVAPVAEVRAKTTASEVRLH